MRKGMILMFTVCAIGMFPGALAAAGTQNAVQQMNDCSTMSMDMQQFAQQLTPANKAMFCGQFTDGQRASAMQMASTQAPGGVAVMPDDAVQKVAGASGTNPQGKTPTGCPVK